MALSERTFGVEIECGHKTLGWAGIHGAVGTHFAGKGYSVGADGSGIEVRTPVLKGEEGFAELERIMRFLVDKGCYVARADGMHTHIGAEGFQEDEEACKVLMRTWYHNQALIEKMVSPHRANSYVCSKVSKADAEEFGQWIRPGAQQAHHGKNWGPRMKSMGLSAIPRKGTIEFRLHEGCLDFVKASAWVKFCQAMLDHAMNERTVLSCKSKTDLLKSLSLPEDVVSVLRKRQVMMPRVGGAPRPQWLEPDGVERA